MAHRALRRGYSLDDYWAIEDNSPERFEFWQGDIVAMAGGSPRHNQLTAQLLRLFGNAVAGGPCVVLSGDQRLRTADGLYSYADASIFCEGVALSADPRPTATNPTVLFEVLSPSTREYDRGDKRELYQQIPSLRDLLLVEQDQVVVEHWLRADDRFELRVLRGRDAAIELTGCRARVRLAEIYEGVALPG